jgi:hypothetical protein
VGTIILSCLVNHNLTLLLAAIFSPQSTRPICAMWKSKSRAIYTSLRISLIFRVLSIRLRVFGLHSRERMYISQVLRMFRLGGSNVSYVLSLPQNGKLTSVSSLWTGLVGWERCQWNWNGMLLWALIFFTTTSLNLTRQAARPHLLTFNVS